MLSTHDYFSRLKDKLEEWHDALVVLEEQARVAGHDSLSEVERHKLELQDMFMELQQRIDELHQFTGNDMAGMSDSIDAAWKRLNQDLSDMSDSLYAGN